MKLLDETRNCYTEQADQFIETRKKHWPVFPLLFNALPAKRPLTIADIGCGGGRLYGELATRLDQGAFSYIGVDNAQGMITAAQKSYPQADFLCSSMIDFLSSTPQESLDVVVALASLQHIFGSGERMLHLHHIYKTLSYGGRCILVNWSFSDWFLKKYTWQVAKGVGRSLVAQRWAWNDLVIPRHAPDEDKTYKRYYHIFTRNELEKLARMAGFVVKESAYTQQGGGTTTDWHKARNTFLVLEKTV